MNKSNILKLNLLLCVAACSVGTGTLLAFLGAEGPSNVSQRMLTFADRVAYQRAIEEVYWRHRIWPKENAKPKPSLDEVMSQAQIEKKVEDYLRDSQALEVYWQGPITPDQLQAEMERIARDTKQPEVLQELFEALGNDPFVIAECLARPILTERLTADLAVVAGVSPALAVVATPLRGVAQNVPQARDYSERHGTQPPVTMAVVSANYALPAISGQSDNWTPSGLCTDTWTATTLTNAPAGRHYHTAVWTGSEMIVWGGNNGSLFNTGGRYNPSTDSWTATSTNGAPTSRSGHTAVWTGTQMIVWGGLGGGDFNTGGRYNPSTDSWTATSTNGAPTGRNSHTAVWTGSEMIVWGGLCCYPPGALLNTGGRYNPSTDSWTATSATNAPAGRYLHTAVWNTPGSEMIVWGGNNGSYLNTGGRYNPGTDSWTATSTTNAPAARYLHTAVWTGTQMIVWGGFNGSYLNTGGRYCAQSGPTPTPTPTPTATATATPTATPTPTPTASPTPTATPTPTPTPTPCTGRCAPTPRPHPTPAPRP
ncbi:MAG TPA: hypothetical protein VGM65_14585 [Candidatus Udaeobacter sp.]